MRLFIQVLCIQIITCLLEISVGFALKTDITLSNACFIEKKLGITSSVQAYYLYYSSPSLKVRDDERTMIHDIFFIEVHFFMPLEP